MRLARQPAALVLLADSPAHLTEPFVPVAILPLLFTLDDLIAAIQQASRVACARALA